jgi:hypothetical protein
VETTLALNAFFADLVEGLSHEEDVELIDARSTHWTARSGGAAAPRGIDAFGCLRSGSSPAPFFVVWDRAGAPIAHRRLLVPSWYRADDSRNGPLGRLPTILVVCPGEREAVQWTSALEGSAQRRARPPLPVYLAMAKEVRTDGPLAACWRRPGGQRAEGLLDRLGWRLPTTSGGPQLAPAVRLTSAGSEGVSGAPPLRSWSTQLAASPATLRRATVLERCAALALTVSATQKLLLEWIGHHPFLSAGELATLLELREGAVGSLLLKLAKLRVVNSIARPVGGDITPPHRYFLTSAGLHLLAARDGVPPRRYLREGVLAAEGAKQDGARRLTGLMRHFEHTVEANGFAVALAGEAAEQRKRGGDHRLDAWLSAAEGQEWFRCDGRPRHVWPDARFLLRINDVVYDVFLEWDRGLVRARDYGRKLAAYALFFAALGEAALEHKRLLVVTASREAEERIFATARKACESSPVLARVTYVTTTERVKRFGAVAPIWWAPRREDRSLTTVTTAQWTG